VGDAAPVVLEVGRILRAHGLKGEVVVRFTSDRVERRSPGAVVEGPGGPLTVDRARAASGGDWVEKSAEIRERGVVHEVHEGSASDVLLLDTGHLVPVTFVVGREPGRILVDAPDGLFDL